MANIEIKHRDTRAVLLPLNIDRLEGLALDGAASQGADLAGVLLLKASL